MAKIIVPGFPKLGGIQRIGGGGFAAPPPSFTGILDSAAGPFGAWSIARRLATSYEGPLARLRESEGNNEAEFGYTSNGNLDVAAIQAWLDSNSAASAFIVAIFDQSGEGQDMYQADPSKQPLLALDDAGGHAAAVFDGGDDSLAADCSAHTSVSVFSVLKSARDHIEWYDTPRTELAIASTTDYQSVYMMAGQNAGAGTTRLGNSVGEAAAWQGWLSEFFIYDGSLGTTERDAFLANQAAYYGL
jgi:hypothetical protein